MKKFVIVLLLFFFVENSFCDPPLCKNNCPVNEVYSRCGAGICEATCWKRPEPKCPCVQGCICAPGLVRDPNTYKCVPAKNCPLIKPGQCPKNEEWSKDLAGCQKTCNNREEKKCLPIPGCVCKKGYIRSSVTNQCIPLAACNTCPPGYSLDVRTKRCQFCCRECAENEKWSDCGTACEASCKTIFEPPQNCNFLCKPGCFCKEGYVRDSTGKCIPKEWCKGKNIV